MDRKWLTLSPSPRHLPAAARRHDRYRRAAGHPVGAETRRSRDLQWVIDAYALTLAALLLTAGSLADLFGRRRSSRSASPCSRSARCCAGSPAARVLSLARAFQGVGGATMFATGLALLAHAFHGRERGVAFGVFGAVTGVAAAVGPVLGGALTSGFAGAGSSWSTCRSASARSSITLRAVEESRIRSRPRVHCLGLVTFTTRPRSSRLRLDPLQRRRLGLRPQRRSR